MEAGWSWVLRGALRAEVGPISTASASSRACSPGVLLRSLAKPVQFLTIKAALAHEVLWLLLSSLAFVTFSSAVRTCVAPCHQ